MSKKQEKRENIGGDYIETTIGNNVRDVVVGKDIDIQKVAIEGDVRDSTVVTTGKDAAGKDVIKEIPTRTAFERVAATATMTLGQLEKNYEQARTQARNWSRMSLVAACLGFLMVLAGIVSLILGHTTVGIVTSISGIIPEIAAALFFNQAKRANKRVDAYHKNLLQAEKVQGTIELCETIEDDQARDRLKETIIKQVLAVADSTNKVDEP